MANFEFAPPMTVRKFKTMQDRRVPVSIKCELELVEVMSLPSVWLAVLAPAMRTTAVTPRHCTIGYVRQTFWEAARSRIRPCRLLLSFTLVVPIRRGVVSFSFFLEPCCGIRGDFNIVSR